MYHLPGEEDYSMHPILANPAAHSFMMIDCTVMVFKEKNGVRLTVLFQGSVLRICKVNQYQNLN